MKKISYLLVLLFFLAITSNCSGYKRIFSASNLEFDISDYSISGDKDLGNQIYTKLYNLSASTRKKSASNNFYVLINSSKDKQATAKNTAGKILGYRIRISSTITIKDLSTGNDVLSENFTYSATYEVQSQFSETVKLENRTIENLVNEVFQNLLIRLSEKLI